MEVMSSNKQFNSIQNYRFLYFLTNDFHDMTSLTYFNININFVLLVNDKYSRDHKQSEILLLIS